MKILPSVLSIHGDCIDHPLCLDHHHLDIYAVLMRILHGIFDVQIAERVDKMIRYFHIQVRTEEILHLIYYSNNEVK